MASDGVRPMGEFISARLRVGIAFVALAVAAASPFAARAMSAFALGLPDDVAAKGVAIGTGYNYSTREGAENRAMQECLKQQDAPAETRALCKVVANFDNQCVAVAMDPQPGTPGFGWAVGATAADANNQAMANCRATAGSDRADSCVVSATSCDTKSSP
jgi:hypothetical protein